MRILRGSLSPEFEQVAGAILHPLVGMDRFEPFQDQARLDEQCPDLRDHLGHDAERDNRQAEKSGIERRDASAADRVMLGDRMAGRVEREPRNDRLARGPFADGSDPRSGLRVGPLDGFFDDRLRDAAEVSPRPLAGG